MGDGQGRAVVVPTFAFDTALGTRGGPEQRWWGGMIVHDCLVVRVISRAKERIDLRIHPFQKEAEDRR